LHGRGGLVHQSAQATDGRCGAALIQITIAGVDAPMLLEPSPASRRGRVRQRKEAGCIPQESIHGHA
jgi:hypothetical protein